MNEPAIEEHQTPHPPRFKWLKRLGAAYLLLVLLAVGTWYGFDHFSKRAFDAEVANIHAAGEPVFAADFTALPGLPDSRNAALLYNQAGAGIAKLTPEQVEWDARIDWELKLTGEQHRILRTFPVDYAGALQLMRDARSLKQAQWPRTYVSPLINTRLQYLSNSRQLANVAGYSAVAHHLDGNDAELIDIVRDTLHQADLLAGDSICMVDTLVAVGIAALACNKVDETVFELAIDEAPRPSRHASTQPSTQPAKPASRQQVRALIDELLNDEPIITGSIRAMRGERAMQMDGVEWMAQSGGVVTLTGPRPSPVGLIMRPSFRRTGVRFARRSTQRAKAMEGNTLVAVQAGLPDFERDLSGMTQPKSITRRLESILEPSYGRFAETRFRVQTQRRSAAIKLAIRLYQRDHDGKFPDSLEQLLPTYLTAVPTDPFAADGSPLRYVKSMQIDGVRTPVIYSVSTDGVDAKASTQPARRRTTPMTVFESPWERDDLVFPLLPPPLRDPPPPEPIEPIEPMLEEEPTTLPAEDHHQDHPVNRVE